MTHVTPLSPELSRSVSALARSLVAGARTRTLYPPDHPAVKLSVERLSKAIDEACNRRPFGFGVTPDTLLLQGAPAPAGDRPITEAAAWLHHRDILQVTFEPDPPLSALDAVLSLLAEDPASVRERGGPAAVWQAQGHPCISIDQIDFSTLLDDHDVESPARRKDALWHSIVRAVLDRRQALDAATQARLLEIAGDSLAIGDLAQDVMAPACTPDGSPLLTSQAAAVIAAYRHLVGTVDLMAPDRRPGALQNLAAATLSLDPRVVMQILSADGGTGGVSPDAARDLRKAVADAMDDAQVAQLLATTLAIDGQATSRLATVFSTIAPDDDRRRRVLTMTRSLLSASAFGQGSQFQSLWVSMEELLLTYDERPFVSDGYRDGLDQVGARAETMAAEVPGELSALLHTLDQDNVRRLSVTLVIDLLALERDPARATELASDVAGVGEDLLLAGEYAAAVQVTAALARHAAESRSPASPGSRLALDALVGTAAYREAVAALGELDEEAAGHLAAVCAAIGPAAVDALRGLLDEEAESPGRRRASAIVRSFGARAAGRLAPLVGSPHWYARRNAAELLGQTGSADAVPLLQPLLRGDDMRVTQAAVRALSAIDDPSAARSVHTVLRASTGEARRAVIAALVAERDPRVVPLLVRILDDSDALGADHAVVLDTLGAVGAVGGDLAIPAVVRLMRTTRWFARAKLRSLKTAGVQALRRIGSPAAAAALAQAAATGDRLLRRAAGGEGDA